jgi:prepilin-type N-terminal cleavage/methylation domain-containing protein
MRTNQHGFTLLEMMIGITLMALVMTTVLIGLRIASRAVQQGESRLGLIYSDEERSDFMAKQIDSLVPYRVRSTESDMAGQFTIVETTGSCFRFLSSYGSHYRNRSGLILVEYGLVGTSPGQADLYLRETAVQDDTALLHRVIQGVEKNPDTRKTTLIYRPFLKQPGDLDLFKNLNEARFEYLAPASEREAAHWVSDWQPQPNVDFPLAARFAWEQDGHEEQAVFPIRARSFPK